MKKKLTLTAFIITLLVMVLGLPVMAGAAEAPLIDTGDTAFIMICTAMVMIMTPGLALFYGGMVRKKNVLSIILHIFIIVEMISSTDSS